VGRQLVSDRAFFVVVLFSKSVVPTNNNLFGRISPFTQDFKASHQFSFSWWSKPVASSRGMPEDFRASVNFFSKLVPPKTFFDLQESHPYKEQISKLDMANTISEGWIVPGASAESNTESRNTVKVSTIIPYV